jgi:hypothetical protein
MKWSVDGGQRLVKILAATDHRPPTTNHFSYAPVHCRKWAGALLLCTRWNLLGHQSPRESLPAHQRFALKGQLFQGFVGGAQICPRVALFLLLCKGKKIAVMVSRRPQVIKSNF